MQSFPAVQSLGIRRRRQRRPGTIPGPMGTSRESSRESLGTPGGPRCAVRGRPGAARRSACVQELGDASRPSGRCSRGRRSGRRRGPSTVESSNPPCGAARAPRSAVNVVEKPWDLVMSWPVKPNAWAWRRSRRSLELLASGQVPRGQAPAAGRAASSSSARSGAGSRSAWRTRPTHRSTWSRTWRGTTRSSGSRRRWRRGRAIADLGSPTHAERPTGRGTSTVRTRRRSSSASSSVRQPLRWGRARGPRVRRRAARRGSGRGHVAGTRRPSGS